MAVVKRDKNQSAKDLAKALEEFILLLEGQKEDEAVKDLNLALSDIKKFPAGSNEFKAACDLIVASFGDRHELEIYSQPRKMKENETNWTDADMLFMASTRVLNLLKRL